MNRTLEMATVPKPCTVPWDSMQGDDERRFCTKCKQTVYNLSAMTREHATAIAEQPACVRFFRRADGTVITKDCGHEALLQRRRWWTRTVAVLGGFVAITFTLVLGIDLGVNGPRRAWFRNVPPVRALLDRFAPHEVMGAMCFVGEDPPRNDEPPPLLPHEPPAERE
jgi:hypothetical protein